MTARRYRAAAITETLDPRQIELKVEPKPLASLEDEPSDENPTALLFSASSKISSLCSAASAQLNRLELSRFYSTLVESSRRILPYCSHSLHLTIRSPLRDASISETEADLSRRFAQLYRTFSERCGGLCGYILFRSFSQTGLLHYHASLFSSVSMCRIFRGFPAYTFSTNQELFTERLQPVYKRVGCSGRRKIVGFRSIDRSRGSDFCTIWISEHSGPETILAYALKENVRHRNFSPELCASYGLSPIQVSETLPKLKIHTALRRLLSMRAYLRTTLRSEIETSYYRAETRKQLEKLPLFSGSAWHSRDFERNALPSLALLFPTLLPSCQLPAFELIESVPDRLSANLSALAAKIWLEYETWEPPPDLEAPFSAIPEPLPLPADWYSSGAPPVVSGVTLVLRHGEKLAFRELCSLRE